MLLIAIAIVGTAFTLWYWGRKPAIHRNLDPARLRALLQTLLREGNSGSVLFVQGRSDVPFLQVMKYESREHTGLQLDFPRAE